MLCSILQHSAIQLHIAQTLCKIAFTDVFKTGQTLAAGHLSYRRLGSSDDGSGAGEKYDDHSDQAVASSNSDPAATSSSDDHSDRAAGNFSINHGDQAAVPVSLQEEVILLFA